MPASPSVLIVFVTRSGIDASRFSPSSLSFMKPEMILRPAKSDALVRVRVRVKVRVRA